MARNNKKKEAKSRKDKIQYRDEKIDGNKIAKRN